MVGDAIPHWLASTPLHCPIYTSPRKWWADFVRDIYHPWKSASPTSLGIPSYRPGNAGKKVRRLKVAGTRSIGILVSKVLFVCNV